MPNIPLAERLRPRTIDEYIGQEHLVGKNGVFRKFFETGNVPSFILWGPPGVGKTTLAKIVATQLERPFFTLSAVTSGVKDVREVIESARKQRFFDQKAPLLFIDEIHRFNKSQQDSLLGAVEQGVFTLIGATTRAGQLSAPLRDRFGVTLRLELYTPEELAKIVTRSAGILNVSIAPEGAMEIARRSRGTPRIANRMLRRVRDFAEVRADGVITREVADEALRALEIDRLGLDPIDYRMLRAIIENYGGGPVGIDTLAATIGEESVTLWDVYEPYLMQLGFLTRTPRGRCVTRKAYEHLGLSVPASLADEAEQLSLN